MRNPRVEDDNVRDDEDAASSSSADVTHEVGSEGGSEGEMELEIDRGTAVGSEAGETWQPTSDRRRTILHDERGIGKRSP